MADLLMKMPIPYEPKRQNRFILRFPSSLGINEWFVESTKRPSTSDAWYLIGVAVPVKVGNGSKVTAPVVGFTV